jgi:hypothetical protein
VNGAKKADPDEMRMSSADFDRIMGQVLSVKPKAKKAKKAPAKKPKKTR